MNSVETRPQPVQKLDSGLRALCGIAAYYQIAADPESLQRELALIGRSADDRDVLRAAKLVGLRARLIRRITLDRLRTVPVPAIVQLVDGTYHVFAGVADGKRFRLVDPISKHDRFVNADDLLSSINDRIILLTRRAGGAGVDPRSFGLKWFLPSIWRYRKPIAHVLLASLFIQVFALVTPLFFQLVVDKVLSHKGYSTLTVLVAGIVIIGIFDVTLQYLRTYVLSHTTNRIDVELGQKLFRHLLRLPLQYFESRSAGQTVARVRELETIRSFLTGQALFSLLDLIFTFVFIEIGRAHV